MTPELIKSLITALWVVGAAVVAGVVAISAAVFKVGKKAGEVEGQMIRLEEVAKKVEKNDERLEMIPVIKQQVEQLAFSMTEERRRFNSVLPALMSKADQVPNLMSKVDQLWGKVFSIDGWRKSRPNMNGNGE